MASDPEDQLRAGALLWALAREGIHLQGVPFVVVIEIGDIVADGIAKGLSSQTIAEQIAPLLDGDFKRALMIVRTERARAMSSAEYANARDAGDYDKQWLDDEIACPICKANAAQGAIPITTPFQGGALYPPQHPNCRCALQPVAHHQEKPLVYLIDDHPEDDTPPPRKAPARKVQPRKAAKMAQPSLPLTKAVVPDLAKVDLLDDDSPLAQLTKALQSNAGFRADYRRRLLSPTPLEKSVGLMEQDIAKVLAYVEPRAHFRSRNGNGAHPAPPQPLPSAVAVEAHHYSYDDEPENPRARELRKAIDADPRRDTRVANIRRLLGLGPDYERVRFQALEARIATLKSDISKALMIGSTVPQPTDRQNHN